jgi:hypothetical protein
MSLYGDLPLTVQGSDAVGSLGGWSSSRNDDPVDKKRRTDNNVSPVDGSTVTSQENIADKTNPSSSSSTTNPTKFLMKPKATLTAFKPRQTTTAPVHRTSTSSAVRPVTYAKPSTTIASTADAGSMTGEMVSEDSSLSFNFECDDEYNPHRPNDYISWCDERAAARRLERLDEENKLLYEEQQNIRLQREAEKAAAAERGDVEALQTMMSQGRGRGRGLSNLPSWLTKGSLKHDDEGGQDPATSHHTRKAEYSQNSYEDADTLIGPYLPKRMH